MEHKPFDEMKTSELVDWITTIHRNESQDDLDKAIEELMQLWPFSEIRVLSDKVEHLEGLIRLLSNHEHGVDGKPMVPFVPKFK